MTVSALIGVNTIMDVINSYTTLDGRAKYIWAATILARKCPFFMDMPMRPSNQIFSNIGARQTYLPSPGTRRFNEGVSPTASHSTPYTEGIAMVEDYSEVDKVLCDMQNDPSSWRAERDSMKVEAMTQKAEALILYGSLATDPGAFVGLTPRANSLTHYPNDDSTWDYNVVSAGGTSAASIWVIEWGEGKIFGIYPKNLPAGIKIEDLGEVTVLTNSLTAPKYMQAYRTHLALYFGINVEDERCMQRICNVTATGASTIFNPDDLITMINRLPSSGESGSTVIYVPRAIKTQMDIAAYDKSNALYTVSPDGDVFGRPVTRFRGIPVKVAETMSIAETTVA